jgi:DNA polymerase III subunit gamma/tau
MASLYRNYRPQKFSEVVNQGHIITTLKNAVAGGSFAHAYLFTGPRGTGKTSVARILARAINCPNQKDGEPCNQCPVCLSFMDGSNLDLVEIDAASNTGIENVREIIEHLKFTPTSAKYKVFIVDEVHMLSKGAFNALLKTLEEPPAHALFILATTEIHKVPATIISRTQRFDFQKINREQIFEHLKGIAKQEKISIDDQSLQLVAGAAEGGMRDALSILDKLSAVPNLDIAQTEQLLGLTNTRLSQKFFGLLLGTDSVAAIENLESLFQAGVDPVQFNKDFLEYLRSVLLYKMGAAQSFVLDAEQLNELKSQTDQVDMNRLLFIIRLFMKAHKDFQSSPNAELPLEIAAAESMQKTTASVAVKPIAAAPRPAAAPKVEPASQGTPKEIVVEEKPIVEQKKELPEVLISQEQFLAAWPGITQEAKEKSSTLFTVLQNAEIKNVESNVVTLNFSFKFHKESLDNPRNKDILVQIMTEKFQTPMMLKNVLDQTQRKEADDASSVLADVFGEEMV